ncbi:DNA recombination protein RmuC [uncultured Sneathia sp.]|uniref:DNA recombination protein RmuC n=1 Tax=uncultured Sneathia sp. TaxID=278067 RepID=UPI00259909AC|nr:DNA recombination protein RmuC [uncultured Sneathia sp.]
MLIISLMLFVVILLLAYLIYINSKKDLKYEITEKIVDKNNEIKEGITKNIFDNKKDIIEQLNLFKDNARETIDNNMDNLTKKLEDKLKDSNSISLDIVKNMTTFKEDIHKNIDELINKNIEKLDTNSKNITSFKEEIRNEIYKNLDILLKRVEEKLEQSNKLDKNTKDSINNFKEIVSLKLEESLKEGFKKSNETFASVLERLSKIDEAQKNIDKLSQNVLELQKVLTDKKLRGNFGEVQLSQILYNVFGEKGKLYDLQYSMKEKKVVDAIIFSREPLGLLPIDSKFPLENFNRIQEGLDARKSFVDDIKKHIDDISNKYVVIQNLNQAIMFIPSEAVYIYILSSCPELINYSYEKKVWIASPTTLMAIATTIQLSIINIEKNENAENLYESLRILAPEFKRYKERWTTLIKDFEKIEKDMKELSTTSKKIGDKFEKINTAQ